VINRDIIMCPHIRHRDQLPDQTKWSANRAIDRSCGISLVAVGDDTGDTAVDHGWEWVEPRLRCSTRVDVLESYRDKKGHPKDTPDSRRRNPITIDIDSLGTRSLRTLGTMTREREREREMLDFKTPPLNNSLSQLFYKQEVIVVLRCIMKLP